MKPNEKTRKALTAWQKELEAILAPLIPTEPYPGIVLEPDFRRLVIPSPSPVLVEAAIDAVTDYAIRQELTARARRLEADLTNFDCNKRRFHEECANMRIAHERQENGTLSDAPEALKQVRRNLKGDIDRIRELIDGAEEEQATATPNATTQQNQEGFEEVGKRIAEVENLITTYMIPRTSDYQVGQKVLSKWLAMKNVATSVRQIQRWEQYLKTNGQKGTKPPDGYTLQTRLTTANAEAWVSHYATQERGKITTRNFFNERTMTRDKKPARPQKTEEAT